MTPPTVGVISTEVVRKPGFIFTVGGVKATRTRVPWGFLAEREGEG